MLLLNPRHLEEKTNSHTSRKIAVILLVNSVSAKSPWNRSHHPFLELGARGTELVTSLDVTVLGNCQSSRLQESWHQPAKPAVNISAPSICPCRCSGEPHLLPPPRGDCKPPVIPAASWDRAEIHELGSLQDLASSRNSHTRCAQCQTSHLSLPKQALTAASGHVKGFVPS